MDNKLFRYNTEIKIIQSSIKKLNPQFSLCDVLVCYHGDNRNMTSLPKKVIEENLYSIYGIPIVGEWIYKLDGTDEKTWGSHGGRIILDDQGIRYEQTTKPFGFVSKEAADNASWVTVIEKDGHTENEYLKLSGCILWTDRYEESKSILDKNYGQSMEIEFTKGFYRDDHYYEAEEFVFSALCILGTNVEPCFESACIGRHYELDSFKQEFALMLDEYKKTIVKKTEGDNKMELVKFNSLLSEIKCEGTDCAKYELLSADENKIYVLDKEDSYKIYSVEYVMSNDDPVINWNTKTEGDITFTEKTEEISHLASIYNEINDVLSAKYDADYQKKLDEKIKEVSEGIETKYVELQDNYKTLQDSYFIVKEKLDKFEAIEAEKEKQSHIEAVTETLERFEKKIGKSPEFIYFKAKLENYEDVDLEKLNKDLTMLSGDVLMNSSSKKSFSYNPVSTNAMKYGNNNETSSRYGNLLEEYMN